jgi:hypothetical protein
MRKLLALAFAVLCMAALVSAEQDRPAAGGEIIRFEYTLPAGLCRFGDEPLNLPSVQEILERSGITFGPGSGAKLDLKTNKVLVWNIASEIELVKAYFYSLTDAPERNITTIFERIEVERSFLDQWLLEHALDRDGTALRKAVQNLIRDDQAIVLDTVVLVGRSGQRAKVESLSEFIYPTEIGIGMSQPVAEVQESVAPPPPPPPPLAVPLGAWETRNTGITLEVEPLISGDSGIVYVNLAPEIVRLAGFESSTPEGLPPERRLRMPNFHIEKIASLIVLRSGHYGFLGSTDPLKASREDAEDPVVLSFVRVDIMAIPVE